MIVAYNDGIIKRNIHNYNFGRFSVTGCAHDIETLYFLFYFAFALSRNKIRLDYTIRD